MLFCILAPAPPATPIVYIQALLVAITETAPPCRFTHPVKLNVIACLAVRQIAQNVVN